MMQKDKDQISRSWPTIFELASTIQEVDLNSPSNRRHGTRSRAVVTKGLTPAPFPLHEGYFEVTPEQVASLRVPRVEVGETIKGFQRDKINRHARKIAKSLLEGVEIPPMMISIFPDEQAYVDDGQHRALASIIARKPVEVVVKRRTVAQARSLFANQGRAARVKNDDTLLTGDSPIELYLQDAVTTENHPWSRLVSPYGGRGMSPTSMVICVGSFVFNTMNQSPTFFTAQDPNDFDTRLADKLARLLEIFGTRTTNNMAFRAKSLRAIAFCAIYVFRRNEHSQPKDEERWRKHMPQFDFAKYPQMLNRENDMAIALLDHWNKRLPESRRVIPMTFR